MGELLVPRAFRGKQKNGQNDFRLGNVLADVEIGGIFSCVRDYSGEWMGVKQKFGGISGAGI